MNPETQLAAARADEDDTLIDVLRRRTHLLNLEVRNRDARIAELERELAALQSKPDEG